MKLSKTAQELYQAITEMPVVDAHEHLPPENEYLRAEYCGPNLFANYIWHDLGSAGLSPDFKAAMRDHGFRPVSEWWPTIKPYWEQVRHTSYARALRITAADHGPPSFTAAESDWKENKESSAVRDLLFDKYLDVAAEADVPVAVHTGYWGDFRALDPKHMLSFAMRRQDVRFDMFHLGMPMIRDAILIGKNLPNVSLNLTWCPIISQVQTVRALDEIIDLVPVNKIIAFGGDYRVSVQKVYGHLVMAREVVAAALARRVEAGGFDMAEALRIAGMWFYDNPAGIYGLDGI